MGYIGMCRCAGYGFQGVYFSNRVYKSERLGLEEGIFSRNQGNQELLLN